MSQEPDTEAAPAERTEGEDACHFCGHAKEFHPIQIDGWRDADGGAAERWMPDRGLPVNCRGVFDVGGS